MDSTSNPVASPSTAEKMFVVFALLLSTGAFMNLMVTPGENVDDASGMVVMQVLWVLIDVATVFLLIRHCKGFAKVLLKEPLLIALVGLALTSVLWSEAPGLTVRRSVALLGTVLIGTYLALRFPLRQQLRLIGTMCWIVIVLSFIFQILGLGAAVDREVGWIGVFVQKNQLGVIMVLSALVFLCLLRTELEKSFLTAVGLTLSTALIWLSHSMTAAIVFVLCLLIIPLSSILRRGIGWAVTTILVTGALGTSAVLWVMANLDLATQAVGKDVTLTGRLQLWVMSVVMALRRPWFGYGYNAFWLGPGSPSAQIWKVLHWQVPHAHNGFLEIWLELGLAGVTLFVCGYLVYLAKALRWLRISPELFASWPFIFLAFLFLTNLTQSSFISRNTISLILYVAVALTASGRSPMGTALSVSDRTL
jgi:exopolysaccharide production protein ExoQ